MQTDDSFALDKASLMERSQEAMKSHLGDGNYSVR